MTAPLALPITSLYAALLAALYLCLSMYVVTFRWRYRVNLGDGGRDDMSRAIRVHANFGEYVPLILVLVLLLELQGYSPAALHAFGSGLVAARVLHAFGLARKAGVSAGRFVGTTLTFTALGVSAGLLLLGIRI